MKAWIEPLKGKYYGTKIRFIADSYEGENCIEVWEMAGYTPSARQLIEDGYTRIDKWRLDDMGSDTHYETETCYKIAVCILNALVKLKLETK